MNARWWCPLVFLLSFARGATSRERNTKPYKLVCVTGHDVFNYFADADYSRCTHVIHNNAGYNDFIESEADSGVFEGLLELVGKLRATNPNVTQLLAWNRWLDAGQDGRSQMTSPEKPAERLRYLTKILTEYDLDGVDLTWHSYYYSQQSILMMPKDNFTDFVQTLRQELDKHGFLLTATVTGRTNLAQQGYDVPKLSQYLDFINLMGYDLVEYYLDENKAQHFAPVDSLPGADVSYSVNSALKYWLDRGADPHKLVLGVSALARTSQLIDEKENGPFAPVWLSNGRYSFSPLFFMGYVDYPQMCLAIQTNPNWTVVRNEFWQAPYAFIEDTWVSYDDEVSVALKMDLVSANDLGGAMIDHYHFDSDPSGSCARKYPLSSAILDKLERNFVTTPKSETTTPSSTTFECRRGGFFEYPGDCTRYYECVPKSRGFHVIVHDCDKGLGFDARVQNCVSKTRVRNC